jgi:hypothetical protein
LEEALSLFKKGWQALMENHTSHVVEDLLSVAKTLTFDLPFTGTQWALGTGKEEAITKSAWQGYDAGVRVLTNMIDTLYRLPLSGATLDRTASMLLRWQRMSNAVTDTVFSRLWHTIGVPTTTELRTLEETIAHLATEVREQRDTQEILMNIATRRLHSVETTERTNLPESRSGTYAALRHQFPPTVTRTAHHKGN